MATKKVVGTAVVKVTGESGELTRSLDAARSKIDKFASNARSSLGKYQAKIKSVAGTFTKLTAIVTAFGIGALAATSKALESIDKIAKSAKNIGLSAEAFQELSYAADLSGVSVDLLQKSIATLEYAVTKAKDGTTTFVDAFAKMGLTVQDLRSKSPEELINAVADGLRTIKDPVEQAGIAIQLFGKRGLDMLELFKQGSSGLDELRKKARELGIVLDNDLVAATEKNNDKLNTMKKIISVQWLKVWADLAPTVIRVSEAFATLAERFGEFVASFQDNPDPTLNSFNKAITGVENELAHLRSGVTETIDSLEDFFSIGSPHFNETQDKIIALEKTLTELRAQREAYIESINDGTPVEIKSTETVSKHSQAYKKLIESINQDRQSVSDLIDEQEALNEAYADGSITSEEFNKRLDENNKKLLDSAKAVDEFRTPIMEMFDSVKDVGNEMQSEFVKGIDGASQALADFALNGKLDVADMARSIIADLIKIQIRAAIISALGLAFPSLSGASSAAASTSTAGSSGPSTRYVRGARAAGGPVSSGSAYLVGERGPELFVPKSPGTIIPNNAVSQGTSGGITVNVTNQGTPQGVESATSRQSPDGYILDVVLKDLNRGGPLSQSFSRKFGVSRR